MAAADVGSIDARTPLRGGSRECRLVRIDEAAFGRDDARGSVPGSAIAPDAVDYRGRAIVASTPRGIDPDHFSSTPRGVRLPSRGAVAVEQRSRFLRATNWSS